MSVGLSSHFEAFACNHLIHVQITAWVISSDLHFPEGVKRRLPCWSSLISLQSISDVSSFKCLLHASECLEVVQGFSAIFYSYSVLSIKFVFICRILSPLQFYYLFNIIHTWIYIQIHPHKYIYIYTCRVINCSHDNTIECQFEYQHHTFATRMQICWETIIF